MTIIAYQIERITTNVSTLPICWRKERQEAHQLQLMNGQDNIYSPLAALYIVPPLFILTFLFIACTNKARWSYKDSDRLTRLLNCPSVSFPTLEDVVVSQC